MPPAPRREAATMPLTLTACEVVEGIGAVDAATARAHVPPGFTPVEAGGRVLVAYGAHVCGGDGASRAYLAIAVTPPAALADPRFAREFWEPEHFVGNDAFARALFALGAPQPRANVTVQTAPPLPGLRVEAGNGTHAMQVATAPLAPGGDRAMSGVFREWFAAPGGYGYLAAEFSGAATRVGAGPATMTTAEGSAARQILGASPVLAGVVIAATDYAQAEAGYVPFPPQGS